MKQRQIKAELEERLNLGIKGEIPRERGMVQTESGAKYFIKTRGKSKCYLCEANGLRELKKAKVIKVAIPVLTGEDYILTEYISTGQADTDFFKQFGKCLAQLHKYNASYYGFVEDNFIGANPQENVAIGIEKNTWTEFYFNKRLLYQYRLAEENGYATDVMTKGIIKLETKLEKLLSGSDEEPCLLHGDLWAGNFICNEDMEAVLIDPAVYYGHREADMAMTRMFGGFPSVFYEAYQEEYPMKPGWEFRENLYRLYHVLNHLNLFGESYLDESERIIDTYANA